MPTAGATTAIQQTLDVGRSAILHQCGVIRYLHRAAGVVSGWLATNLVLAALVTSLVLPGSTCNVQAQSETSAPNEIEHEVFVVGELHQKPVVGAAVTVEWLVLASDRSLSHLGRSKHTTDSEGRFVLKIPKRQVAIPGRFVSVTIQHGNYAPRQAMYPAASIPRLELAPADFIVGSLVSPKGAPVAEALLLATSAPNSRTTEAFYYQARSASDGTFRVNVCKDGNSVLYIFPKEYAAKQVISSGRTDLGKIRLEEGSVVTGRVLDARGAPVSRAWVNISARDSAEKVITELIFANDLSRSALTDEQGQFTAAPLSSGAYRVAVEQSPGFFHGTTDRSPSSTPVERSPQAIFTESALTVTAGVNPQPLRLQAVPHVRIAAKFVNSAARPVAPMRLLIHGTFDGHASRSLWRSVVKDNASSCIIPHGLEHTVASVEAGPEYSFRYRISPDAAWKGIAGKAALGTARADILGLEIMRFSAPQLCLRIVDEDGRAIEAPLVITAEYEWGTQPIFLQSVPPIKSDVKFNKDKDGCWCSARLLPDDELTVEILSDDHRPESRTLTLEEGERKEVTVMLRRRAQ